MIREFSPLVRCWYLTGATASGKTAISLSLAKSLNAEIVSMDSMAVYRGMNIGTAKPHDAARAQVPHHLIDVVDPDQEYSLAQYLGTAHEVVKELQARGRNALFVGGTPLYLISLLRGACDGPPADKAFRAEVEREVERVGTEALHARLELVDPLSAAKLHPNDQRRIIRALEVYTLTGQPISHLQTQFEGKYTERCKNVFVISRNRADLHQRIQRRTDDIFQRGLVEEVAGLRTQFGTLSRTALQGVGYQETLNYLTGHCSLESAMEETTIRTRRYARRQETWFRGLEECHWVPVDDARSAENVVEEICQRNDENREKKKPQDTN